MIKEGNLEKIVNAIQLEEGNAFECDKDAILGDYKKQEENHSGIAIKILSVFGGIMASLAFVGFLLLTGIYDSEAGILILGIVGIVGALWIDKAFDKIFLDAISVSSFIIGLSMLIAWFNMMEFNEHTAIALVIVIASISLVISQGYVLSFIAILCIQAAFLFFVFLERSYVLYQIFIMFNALVLTGWMLYEAKIITVSNSVLKLYNPIRIGLIISLLVGLTPYLSREMTSFFERDVELTSVQAIWVISIVIIASILFLVSKVIEILNIVAIKKKAIIYILSSLILLVSAYSPSILGAILVILLSFYVNYKTGFVFGIISLIYFVSRYYYDLNFTLLTKSILLFSSGIICIAFYLFINHKPQTNEKV